MDLNKTGGAPQAPQITEETVKNAKTVECTCGGKVFSEKMMFKKISAILSPTAKEELFPINLIVCEKCGLTPEVFNPQGVIPIELTTKSIII